MTTTEAPSVQVKAETITYITDQAPRIYQWDYARDREQLVTLYNKAMSSQWNSVTELDWSIDVDPEALVRTSPQQNVTVDLARAAAALAGSPLASWGDKEFLALGIESLKAQLSQFMHGEQGAMMTAAKIVETVPWIDAKYYAATQTMDEARHTEVFAKYLHTKLGEAYPMSPFLEAQITALLEDSRWDIAYLGMQIVIESLALAAFGSMLRAAPEPLLKKLLRYVMSDEARHVAFGVISLGEYYRELSAAELKDRQEFLCENTLRNRARSTTPEIWERMGVSADAVRPFLMEGAATLNKSAFVAFQHAFFGKLVPNVRKLGLLDANDGYLRRQWGEAGLLEFEFADDTGSDYEAYDEVARDRAACLSRALRVTDGLRAAAAIVGVADAVSPTGQLELSGRALEAAVIKEALADAGLTIADVDGVCHSTSSMALAEYLGIHPTFTDSTNTGGSSYEVHAEHAAAAIAAGLCEVVVGVYAATPRGDRARGTPRGRRPDIGPNPMAEWEWPYGLRMPMGPYALAASRHMAMFGTTSEQLARIAVSTRDWATLNPRARYQEPITVDDVLASPMESSPLHRLDCCLVTDGAGAFVMTTADRARHLAKPPVLVLGAGTCHDHLMISQMPDLTTTPGARSGADAFAMAGIEPADVDVLMGYDSFTITALLHLEDLGFCPKGEGGPFAADGKLGPGGALPMNTNGGGLSYTHPGAYGMFLIVEAVRQLRGESGPRQVDGADIAVAHGSGMVLSCMSTIVLGTEATR